MLLLKEECIDVQNDERLQIQYNGCSRLVNDNPKGKGMGQGGDDA
jgi:hypothetical protein